MELVAAQPKYLLKTAHVVAARGTPARDHLLVTAAPSMVTGTFSDTIFGTY